MRKFLSVLMALTILIVPFETNKCMAEEYVSEFKRMEIVISEPKDLESSVILPENLESSVILPENNNKPATSKKSSHKLLITSILVAAVAVSAGVFALNKFSLEGQVGKFLGKPVGCVCAFMRARKDSIVAYIQKTPVLKSLFENTKAFFVTTKGNMAVNYSAFKEAFALVQNVENQSTEA